MIIVTTCLRVVGGVSSEAELCHVAADGSSSACVWRGRDLAVLAMAGVATWVHHNLMC